MTLPAPDAPASLAGLDARCATLAGKTLGQLAAELAVDVPTSLRRHKGWVGNLLERALGASAGNLPVPDFEALGVELKTVPIGSDGQPTESTWVCTVALTEIEDFTWATSRVRHKLQHVLWVPVQAAKSVALSERRVGTPLRLELPHDLERALRRDWEEHVAVIRIGGIEDVTAHRGRYLQIRPKAANARQRGWGIDAGGMAMRTRPRGFYLRKAFVTEVLARHFVLNAG